MMKHHSFSQSVEHVLDSHVIHVETIGDWFLDLNGTGVNLSNYGTDKNLLVIVAYSCRHLFVNHQLDVCINLSCVRHKEYGVAKRVSMRM